MALMPVSMKSAGCSREYGLIGEPVMSRRVSGMTGRAAVDRLADAVEDAAEQLGRDLDLGDLFEEADRRAVDVDALRALEDLDDRDVAGDLEDLAASARCRPAA